MLHGKQKRKEGRRGEAGEGKQLQGPIPGTNRFAGALGYCKQTCKTMDALATLVSSSGSSTCSSKSEQRRSQSLLWHVPVVRESRKLRDDFVWCQKIPMYIKL